MIKKERKKGHKRKNKTRKRKKDIRKAFDEEKRKRRKMK